MKKKFLLLPLLMLVLGSCDPVIDPTDSTTDPTTTGQTDSDSTGTDPGPVEIDPADLNAAVGIDVYSLLPKIYSDDYEVLDLTDEDDEDYSLDVYLVLADWSEDDLDAYVALLDNEFDLGGQYGDYELAENLYLFPTFDDDDGGVLNFYSFAPLKEIDPTAMNGFFGRDVYSLLPPIFSNNYQYGDWSEPTVLFLGVIVWDWDDDAIDAYEVLLEDEFEFDEDEEAYAVEENLFVALGTLIDAQEAFLSHAIFIYSYREAPDRSEISSADIELINTYAGRDVYSMLPPILSNYYEIYDWKDEDFPVDIYIFVDDWSISDANAYLTAINALGHQYDAGEGAFILDVNLYVGVYDSAQGLVINIFSYAVD